MATLLLAIATSSPFFSVSQSAATAREHRSPTPLLIEPTDGFRPVYSFISSAKKSLAMVMYELNDATAERSLVADEHRGVNVRVVLDRAYHGGSYNARAFRYLSSQGVHVRWAPADTIVHEKSIVVDDKRALIATFNLANTSDYYATTRDFGVFDSNREDVAAITRVFDSDWSGRPISQPPPADRGSDLVWSPGSEPVLASVIARAQRTLVIESEEMSDARIISALAGAARRGVDVEVAMTADSSWAPGFDELSRAGVHVRTYSYYANPYIHAKVVVADAGLPDEVMFLGSENFSYASLDYNRELGLITRDGPLIAAVNRTVRADFSRARPWTR